MFGARRALKAAKRMVLGNSKAHRGEKKSLEPVNSTPSASHILVSLDEALPLLYQTLQTDNTVLLGLQSVVRSPFFFVLLGSFIVLQLGLVIGWFPVWGSILILTFVISRVIEVAHQREFINKLSDRLSLDDCSNAENSNWLQQIVRNLWLSGALQPLFRSLMLERLNQGLRKHLYLIRMF